MPELETERAHREFKKRETQGDGRAPSWVRARGAHQQGSREAWLGSWRDHGAGSSGRTLWWPSREAARCTMEQGTHRRDGGGALGELRRMEDAAGTSAVLEEQGGGNARIEEAPRAGGRWIAVGMCGSERRKKIRLADAARVIRMRRYQRRLQIFFNFFLSFFFNRES